MELTIGQRILLASTILWPPTASFDDDRVIEAVRRAVRLTPEELERYSVTEANGATNWREDYPDPDAGPAPAIGEPDPRPLLRFEDTEREFNIGERGLALIRAGLLAADRAGRITTTAGAGGQVNPLRELYELVVVAPLRARKAEASAIDEEIAALEALPNAADIIGQDAPNALEGGQDEATAPRALEAAPVAAPV